MPRSLLSFLTAMLYIALALILVVFSVANRHPVKVDFYPLPYTLQTPFFLLGILIFVLGLLLGSLQGYLLSWKKKRELRHERKRIAALENELAGLKTMPAPAERTHLSPPL